MSSSNQPTYLAAMFQSMLMAFLLLLTLAFASPIEPSSSEPYGPFGHLPQDQDSTSTTSLNLPYMPTLTLPILQPPYVSLHTFTARDAPAISQTAPTLSLTSDLPSTTSTTTTTTTKVPDTVTLQTTASISALRSETGTASTVTLQATTFSLALQSETGTASTVTLQATTSNSALCSETETASTLTLQTTISSSVLRNEADLASVALDSGLAPTPTKWVCTMMCGALDDGGDCSVVSGCVAESESMKVKGGKPPNQRSSAGSVGSSGRCEGMAVLALMILLVFWILV